MKRILLILVLQAFSLSSFADWRTNMKEIYKIHCYTETIHQLVEENLNICKRANEEDAQEAADIRKRLLDENLTPDERHDLKIRLKIATDPNPFSQSYTIQCFDYECNTTRDITFRAAFDCTTNKLLGIFPKNITSAEGCVNTAGPNLSWAKGFLDEVSGHHKDLFHKISKKYRGLIKPDPNNIDKSDMSAALERQPDLVPAGQNAKLISLLSLAKSTDDLELYLHMISAEGEGRGINYGTLGISVARLTEGDKRYSANLNIKLSQEIVPTPTEELHTSDLLAIQIIQKKIREIHEVPAADSANFQADKKILKTLGATIDELMRQKRVEPRLYKAVRHLDGVLVPTIANRSRVVVPVLISEIIKFENRYYRVTKTYQVFRKRVAPKTYAIDLNPVIHAPIVEGVTLTKIK